MIQESLHIRNLGPLKDVVMDDIRPVMVLVGATGSGKSLALKTLAMMRHVAKRSIVRETLKASGVRKTSFRIRKDSYLKFADFDRLVDGTTTLSYTLRHGDMECRTELDKSGFHVHFTKAPLSPSSVGPFMKIAFLSDTRNLVAAWARKGARFQSRILDNYFAETYSLWDEAISAKGSVEHPIGHLGLRLAAKSGGNDGIPEIAIVAGQGKKIPFERGASGEKASIPVSVILRYLAKDYDFNQAIQRSYFNDLVNGLMDEPQDQGRLFDRIREVRTFKTQYLCVHVEEPELSLDPETQVRFAEELMEMLEPTMSSGSTMDASIVFTTHSPYWVTALNTIAEERENYFLVWDRLCGYFLQGDGTAIPLRDEEACLLMTPNMDAASQRLDERYNTALDHVNRPDHD